MVVVHLYGYCPFQLRRHAYQLEDKLRHLSKCNIEEADVIKAREALNHVMESTKVLSSKSININNMRNLLLIFKLQR